MVLQNNLGQIQSTSLSLSAEMQQSLQVLHMDSEELFELVARKAARNPFIQIVPRSWQPVEGPDAIDTLEAGKPSLTEYVHAQIRLLFHDPQDLRLTEHFVAGLSPTGWLERDLGTIAFEASCTEEKAAEVLHRLQECEPAGLFARNLAECLRLQAEDRDAITPVLSIVLDRLSEIADAGPARFAQNHGLDAAEVGEAMRLIRTLNPKPGLEFSFNATPVFPPEIIVKQVDDEWVISLNDDAFPDIRVATDSSATPSGAQSAKEIRDRLKEAKSLDDAVSRRKATLLAVAEQVVRHQPGLLERGSIAIMPLNLNDVASATGMHISTVSRAVNGCLVQTPNGTLPLKKFFSRAVRVSPDGDAAYAGIVALVRQIIEEEDSRHPLSDAAIQRELESLGFTVTTRSVNNHRRTLGFRRASRRRTS